jgi:SNF2 family DNA or RNA helicase
LINDLSAAGHKVLVFSQFVSHLALLRSALREQGIVFSYLDGETSIGERQRRVEAFQIGKGGDVFLISLKAGGTGLTLTAADYVLHLDPWWNPAVEDQASDRAHRLGQTKPVTVYRLIAEGTVEQQILSLHRNKRELVDAVLSGTDHAGKLSTAQLAQLICGESTAEPVHVVELSNESVSQAGEVSSA